MLHATILEVTPPKPGSRNLSPRHPSTKHPETLRKKSLHLVVGCVENLLFGVAYRVLQHQVVFRGFGGFHLAFLGIFGHRAEGCGLSSWFGDRSSHCLGLALETRVKGSQTGDLHRGGCEN